MTTVDAARGLIVARNLIEREGWCRGLWSISWWQDGGPQRQARCIGQAVRDSRGPVAEMLGFLDFRSFDELVRWNEQDARTKEAVIARLEQAIRRAVDREIE